MLSRDTAYRLQADGRLLESASFPSDTCRTASERAHRASAELVTPCASFRSLLLRLDLDYVYNRDTRLMPDWYPLANLVNLPSSPPDVTAYTEWDEFQLRALARTIDSSMKYLVRAVRLSLRSYVQAAKKEQHMTVSGLVQSRYMLVSREHDIEAVSPDLSGPGHAFCSPYFLATLFPSKEHRAGWTHLAEAPDVLVMVHLHFKENRTNWTFMGYTLPQPPSDGTALMPNMLVRMHDVGYLLGPLETGSSKSELLTSRRFESAGWFAQAQHNGFVTIHVARLPSLLPFQQRIQNILHVPVYRRESLCRAMAYVFRESPVSIGNGKDSQDSLCIDTFSEACIDVLNELPSRSDMRFAIHFVHFLLYRALGDTGAFYAVLNPACVDGRSAALACAILCSKIPSLVQSALEQSIALEPAIFGKRELSLLVDTVINSQIVVTGSAWTSLDAVCEPLHTLSTHATVKDKQKPLQAVRHATFAKALEEEGLLATHPYVLAAEFIVPEAETEHDGSQDLAKVRSHIKKLVHDARQKATADWIESGRTKKDPGWVEYMRTWRDTEGKAIRLAHGDPPEATPAEQRESGRTRKIVQVLHQLMHEPAKFMDRDTGVPISIPDHIVEALESIDLLSNPDYIHFYPTSQLERMAKQMSEKLRRNVIYIINDGSSVPIAELLAIVSAGRGVIFAGTESELEHILTP